MLGLLLMTWLLSIGKTAEGFSSRYHTDIALEAFGGFHTADSITLSQYGWNNIFHLCPHLIAILAFSA